MRITKLISAEAIPILLRRTLPTRLQHKPR